MAGRKRQNNGFAWLAGLLCLLTLILVLSLGKRGFLAQLRARQERRRLRQEIESLAEKKTALEDEKENLDDPEYIEKIAREEYGMAKDNEKVYRVVPREE